MAGKISPNYFEILYFDCDLIDNHTNVAFTRTSFHAYFHLILFKMSLCHFLSYEGVSKSFRTGRQERELQMVQLSAAWCSCIAI
jgi:hypothetical protein